MSGTRSFEEWLVPARSRVQDDTLCLLLLLRKHRAEIEEEPRLTIALAALAGAAFSLWRAVFLADEDYSRETFVASVEKFLSTVIRDNAINYRDDKNLWSFRYYLGNARSNLSQFYSNTPVPFYKGEPAIAYHRIADPKFISLSNYEGWEATFECFQVFVRVFEKVLKAPAKARTLGRVD